MKHIQFVKAYKTLQKISNFELPVREAFEVFKLIRELEPVYAFAKKVERQLIEKYKGEIAQDGTVNFIHGEDEKSREEGIENMNMCIQEIDDLNDTEIECEYSPVILSYSAFGEQKIAPNDIMALDGFVNFG